MPPNFCERLARWRRAMAKQHTSHSLAEEVGWQLVLVSSLGQIFLLPTRVEAFVSRVKGRTGWTVWCEKDHCSTTVANTIGRSRDASRPSAREGLHVQAAREWIMD